MFHLKTVLGVVLILVGLVSNCEISFGKSLSLFSFLQSQSSENNNSNDQQDGQMVKVECIQAERRVKLPALDLEQKIQTLDCDFNSETLLSVKSFNFQVFSFIPANADLAQVGLMPRAPSLV